MRGIYSPCTCTCIYTGQECIIGLKKSGGILCLLIYIHVLYVNVHVDGVSQIHVSINLKLMLCYNVNFTVHLAILHVHVQYVFFGESSHCCKVSWCYPTYIYTCSIRIMKGNQGIIYVYVHVIVNNQTYSL